MPNRLNILKKKLDLQISAAMATLMEMQEEATKLSQEDVSTSSTDICVLTDEHIAKKLAKRELTIQRRFNH